MQEPYRYDVGNDYEDDNDDNQYDIDDENDDIKLYQLRMKMMILTSSAGPSSQKTWSPMFRFFPWSVLWRMMMMMTMMMMMMKTSSSMALLTSLATTLEQCGANNRVNWPLPHLFGQVDDQGDVVDGDGNGDGDGDGDDDGDGDVDVDGDGDGDGEGPTIGWTDHFHTFL